MIYNLQQEFQNAMQEEEHQTSHLSMPSQLASKISLLQALMKIRIRVESQLLVYVLVMFYVEVMHL